jgi:hypothetical protein
MQNNPFRDQLTASARIAKTLVSNQPGLEQPAATDTLNQSARKCTICSRGNQQDSTTSVRTGVRKSPERSIVHLRTWAQHVRRKNEQHLWQLLERSRPHPAPRRPAPPPPALVPGEIYRRLPSRNHSWRQRRRVTTTTREVEGQLRARTELQEVSNGNGPAPRHRPPQVRSGPSSAFFLRARALCSSLRSQVDLKNQAVFCL